MVKKALKWTYLMLILFFLYAPIVVMIALSFNASRSSAVWTGFTFDWYKDLLGDAKIMDALKVTLSVAVIATAVSTVLGTLAAIGIHGMKKGWAGWILNVSYLPMTMPDIVTGVSIMMLFVVLKMERGYWTMVMAHIAFDTPYVLFSVLPKLKQMDPNMYEAALDLGCKPFKALTKVIVPQVTRASSPADCWPLPCPSTTLSQLLYRRFRGEQPVHRGVRFRPRGVSPACTP